MAPIENQTGKKKKLHIGKYFFYGFLVLLLSCFIFIFISYGQSKKTGNPPNLFGFNVLVVQSASMEPTIEPGDVVIVKSKKKDTSPALQVQDVITFKQIMSSGEKPTWITHRVVDVTTAGGNTMYITKGDANDTQDKDPVTENNLLGKVVATVPKMGFFFDFIKQPLGMFVCIGLPILILILFEAINLIRTVRTPEEKLVEEAEERENDDLDNLPRVGVRSRRRLDEDIDLSQAGMSPEYAYRPKQSYQPPQEEDTYASTESRRIDDETLYYHQNDEAGAPASHDYADDFGAGFVGGYSQVHGGQEHGFHAQDAVSQRESVRNDAYTQSAVLADSGDGMAAVPNHINAGRQPGDDKKLSLTLSGDESSEFTVNDINICYEDETLNLQMEPCDEPCQIRVKMKNDQAVLSVETPSKQTRFTVLNKDGRPRKISISSENDQNTGALPQDGDNNT